MPLSIALNVIRKTPLSRGKARGIVMKVVSSMSGDNPIRSTYRGVPMFFHMDNNTERKALISGRYEKEELDFLERHLQEDEAIFVDIGANSGLYTQWIASRIRPTAKIIAIEPNPEMCGRIRKNLSLLRRIPSVTIHECAVGECEGNGYIDLSSGKGAAHISDSGLKIEIRLLSSIVERVTAIKIDIEGYEDRALLPFFENTPFKAWPNAIAIETVHRDQWKRDVVAFLVDAGFKIDRQTRSNALLSRPSSKT